ncbi:hypothetical protein N7468_002276 [Penicillium chermesinum]|uniref:Uncharacterized protein n=1 Tax=Penicillium chermesinum TaxID=63820 RepID=A0A9W9PI76_9EURO|nr:uncharacterized protein N7468_002276 [Penicillium chermesinum]KAJ5247293.1 hypothetical protein N7468_002276 [Penicillium chermesinum]
MLRPAQVPAPESHRVWLTKIVSRSTGIIPMDDRPGTMQCAWICQHNDSVPTGIERPTNQARMRYYVRYVHRRARGSSCQTQWY